MATTTFVVRTLRRQQGGRPCNFCRFSSDTKSHPSKNGKLADKMMMAGDGPPPPGVVTMAAVPRKLRSYGKVLRVKGVIVDYGTMTRTLELAEAAAGTHHISGFDSRHERFKTYARDAAPVHGADKWLDSLSSTDVSNALIARGVEVPAASSFDLGEGEDLRRSALAAEVKRCNKQWVDDLLARETRLQLKEMGLEHTGKPWQVSARLEAALWSGDGRSPTFKLREDLETDVSSGGRGGGRSGRSFTAATDATGDSAVEAAAQLAKTLNVDIKLQGATLGNGRVGFALEEGGGRGGSSAGGGSAVGEGDEALLRALGAQNNKQLREGATTGAGKQGSAVRSGGETSFVDSTPKGLPKELTDVKTKYQAKLLAKTGGMLASRKVEVGKGDAEALSWGRSMLAQADVLSKSQGGGGDNDSSEGIEQRWLLGNGVGGLLEYLERRSMKVCLLPDRHTPYGELQLFEQQVPSAIKGLVFVDPKNVAGHFDAQKDGSKVGKGDQTNPSADEPKESTKPSFGIFGFLFGGSTKSASGSSSKNRQQSIEEKSAAVASWKCCIEDSAASMNLQGNFEQLLVFSDRNELLSAARELECHTVAFNPPNQRRVDASTDAEVRAILELKDAIDSLNGISYRN